MTDGVFTMSFFVTRLSCNEGKSAIFATKHVCKIFAIFICLVFSTNFAGITCPLSFFRPPMINADKLFSLSVLRKCVIRDMKFHTNVSWCSIQIIFLSFFSCVWSAVKTLSLDRVPRIFINMMTSNYAIEGDMKNTTGDRILSIFLFPCIF